MMRAKTWVSAAVLCAATVSAAADSVDDRIADLAVRGGGTALPEAEPLRVVPSAGTASLMVLGGAVALARPRSRRRRDATASVA